MNNDLIDQIYRELNTEIVATIDNDVLCNILQAQGWTRVDIDCKTDTRYVEILDWIKQNSKSEWRGRYDSWAFESVEDAILFKLTWS